MRHVILLTLIAGSAFAYTRGTVVSGGKTLTPLRTDNTAMQFLINSGIAPGLVVNGNTVFPVNSDPVGAIRAALATWNRVTAAKIHFQPLQSTTTGVNASDGKHVFVVGGAAEASVVSGKLAVTMTNYTITTTTPPGGGAATTVATISDTDIIINPAYTFSTDGNTTNSIFDLQTVMTHELGHAMGAYHSQIVGSMMYPYDTYAQRILHTDDIAMAAASYPLSPVGTGTVNGKVTLAGAPVSTGLITLIELSSGKAVSSYTASDGTYSILVPPGSYAALAEPFNSALLITDVALGTGQPTSGYQATFLGGNTTPLSTAVAAGATVALADLAVTANATSLPAPYIAQGTAGGTGGLSSAAQAALVVSSGQQLDLGFFTPAGGGTTWDTSTVVSVYGAGVTVIANSTRLEPNNFGGSGAKAVRVTLNIPTTQTPTLATVIFTKGGSSVAMTGSLMIVPPKPTTTSASFVSAASYKGGANSTGLVTPGGLYSAYGIPGSPNLGPAVFAQNGPYDEYGKLPTYLGGVTVTFDGVPAPMFLAFNGQLNFQAPFELAGKTSTQVIINYQGSLSDPITVPVASEQPAFFTVTPLGADSIATNQNGSLNGAQNAAARGEVMTIYGSGLGKLSYNVDTGSGAGGPPAGYTGGYSCLLSTATANVTVAVAFTGWTPTAVGLGQFSMVIPANAPTGTVSVVCTSPSGGKTPTGTLYIK